MSSSLSIPNACLIGPDKPCDDKKATISWELTSDIKHQRGVESFKHYMWMLKVFQSFFAYTCYSRLIFSTIYSFKPILFPLKYQVQQCSTTVYCCWKKNKINRVKSYMIPGWIRFTFCLNPLNPSKKSIDGFPSIPISPWHHMNKGVRVMTGSLCVWSALPWALGSCPGPSSVRNECLEPPIAHMLHVIMVYLPTKLGDLCWANVGKYSSTMVRIWVLYGIKQELGMEHESITDRKPTNPRAFLGLWASGYSTCK